MLSFSVWYLDALSAYLTNPSIPPNDGIDVTASVNLYLAGENNRPDWVQVIKLYVCAICIAKVARWIQLFCIFPHVNCM